MEQTRSPPQGWGRGARCTHTPWPERHGHPLPLARGSTQADPADGCPHRARPAARRPSCCGWQHPKTGLQRRSRPVWSERCLSLTLLTQPVSKGAGSYHKLTRKGCSRPCMICSSLKTFLTSLRSTHFCLFMYFMAYIFLVSFFCTTQT